MSASNHPVNRAAVIPSPRASPVVIQERPYTPPRENELVIKVAALAINPADWATQLHAPELFPWVTYPSTLGSDVGGEVYEVGAGVTRFARGDRVAACAASIMNNRPEEGGFQEYAVVHEAVTFAVPAGMAVEDAVVLPLGHLTAASGLYKSGYLPLAFPTTPKAARRGEVLLIWGAASSVGANAVQLANAAGYDVVATASARNADFVRRCGAAAVVDYRHPAVVDELVAACAGRPVVGCYNAVGSDEAFHACADTLLRTMPGGAAVRRFIACANVPPADVPAGIEARFVESTGLIAERDRCDKVFADFTGPALASGDLLALPEKMVVGKGLESVQMAMDKQKAGVSACKIVVTME